MKLIFLLLLGIGIILTSCNDDENKKGPITKANGDTVIKEIPEWYRTSGYTQKRDKKLYNLLNLPSLENGFDSFQVRILIDCGYETSNLIILENKKSQWNAAFYSFKIHYDENVSPSEIQNLHIENRSPKSGWKIFYDTLIRTGIIDLPDASKFDPKYNHPNDGDGVMVEIAGPKKYRLYTYPSLGLNVNIKDGPWKLNEALKLIEREFNYTRPCEDIISDNH
jgi:hypothetical protein